MTATADTISSDAAAASIRDFVPAGIEDEIFRRRSERGPCHDTGLVDSRLRPVADAAGKDRAEPLQVGGRERRGIVLRVDRLQLTFQDVSVERTAGDEAGETRGWKRLVAPRVGLVAERLPLRVERRSLAVAAVEPATVDGRGRPCLGRDPVDEHRPRLLRLHRTAPHHVIATAVLFGDALADREMEPLVVVAALVVVGAVVEYR